MKWIEICVFIDDRGMDRVCSALAAVGIDQVSIEESSERIAEFLESEAKYWDFADADALAGKEGPCVKAYIADLPENEPIVMRAREAIAALQNEEDELLKSITMKESRMDDEDWANNWKAYYKPTYIGDRLLICPSWETAEKGEHILLRMDPGMVFGTGTHDTTRLCLETLDKKIKGDERILDVGCGSGILAIAAMLLGAKEATFVDIDPVADRVVRENALDNGIVDDKYELHIGDIIEDKHLQKAVGGNYDFVVANIVADVIIALSAQVRSFLNEGGYFLCSGIIDTRRDDVVEAMKKTGLTLKNECESEGWMALLYRWEGDV